MGLVLGPPEWSCLLTEFGGRPGLRAGLDAAVFARYYYLKDELVRFCRASGISAAGDKATLTHRVETFLRSGSAADDEAASGRRQAPRTNARPRGVDPSLDAVIGADFRCSQLQRAFFEAIIGKRFHFGVKFQGYLRSNPHATYAQAIDEWRRLDRARTRGPAGVASSEANSIDPQFEYNTYVRAFFAANPRLRLADAIACWKFRRTHPGPRTYSPDDLTTLGK